MPNVTWGPHKVRALKRGISIARGQLYRADAKRRDELLTHIQILEDMVPVYEQMDRFMSASARPIDSTKS